MNKVPETERRGLTWKDLRNAILFAMLVYVFIILIIYIVDVILLFSVIALIVIALNPIVDFLNRHKIPRGLGTAILTLAWLALIAGIAYYIIPVAINQVKELSTTLPVISRSLHKWTASFTSKYSALGGHAPTFTLANVSGYILPLLGGIATITKDIFYVIAGTILVFISTIYILINPYRITEGALRAINPEHRTRAIAASKRLAIQIRSWVWGVIISMITILLMTWFAMSLVGLKQAFLYGVIAGVLELIPVVGPILAAFPPTLVGFSITPLTGVWVIIAFIFIQQFENHVLIPLVMSRQVSLHPITVIIWVLIMGSVYGIIGIFLATPAAVTAGMLYDELYLCGYAKRCNEAGPRERGGIGSD